MFAKSILAATAVLSASVANGHMMMKTPYPYGPNTLNNSPLNADGSDFPCKLRDHVYDPPTQNNTMAIGEPQTLSFIGSATHGGGSCQISLTTDKYPTKNSQWKVIHSIEGGCPANVPGNLEGGADTPDPTTFQFSIPDSIAPGEYTLAWTWFNRVGNREMYMNCAPIIVTSTKTKRDDAPAPEEPVNISKRSLPQDLPDMFVANINGCMTPEGVDIRFPNPGNSVDLLGEPSNLMAIGQAACTGGPGPGASVSVSVGASAAPAPTVSTPAVSPSEQAVASTPASQTVSPGIFVPTASPEPSATAASSPAAPVVPSSSPAPSSNNSGSISGALSGACSPEGMWNCIGGTSFQRCASGVWSEVMQMAAGTACTAGQSENLKIAAVDVAPRSELHFRRYMARSNHA